MRNHQILRQAGVVGVGSYVPERVLTNFDLEKIVETTDEWIRTRTGISERRIVAENENTSDLALHASENALRDAGVEPGDVDLIIVATVTGDMLFPSTSCLIQHRLGAERAAAFDVSAGCTGFIYGLVVGCKMVSSGAFETVLVVGADSLSRVTNWKDRNTCVLFGDGSGAVVIKSVQEEKGLLAFDLGSNGAGAELLAIPAGGTRLPASHETVDQELHQIYMNGNEVFKFAVRIMGESAATSLAKCGIQSSQVACFIPHQANVRIIDSAAKRLGVPPEKVFVNVHKYGNTSAASIPIALDEAVKSGRIVKDDVVVCVGFGAGLTWGSAVLRW